MANTLKYLKCLYDQELYSNIVRVCDLTLTVCEQKADHYPLSVKFQVSLYYADALFNTSQYVQAEKWYRQALQMRKTLAHKSKNSNNKISENQSEIDVKYKIHLCCLALKQRKAAADILQTIAAKQRTPKINMALGNIYKEVGMERSAITCYKEVLKECPLALEAIENLLKLGINGVEVNSLVLEVSSEVSWLSSWIKAQAQSQARDFSNAIQTYQSMDAHGLLKDNTSLLVNIAYCYHYLCDENRAISILQKALRIDPNLVQGRDLLSTLLAASDNRKHHYALKNLTCSLETYLWSAEHWVTLGNLMLFMKNYEKAVYFGQQACLINSSKNVEALLLKANALIQLKKYLDASFHCTEALKVCPFRFDVHKCLVECYIQTNRLREAESMALNACKEFNFNAESCCLHASCLLKDSMASSKNIKRILERAVAQDKNGTTDALCMLVELLEREQQYEQAVQLMTKALETQKPTSRLHQLLGDVYVSLQKDEDAFHHYTVALKLDPQNQRATEGLNSIGRSVSLYNSRRTHSDQEADPESDTDLWPGSAANNFD